MFFRVEKGFGHTLLQVPKTHPTTQRADEETLPRLGHEKEIRMQEVVLNYNSIIFS